MNADERAAFTRWLEALPPATLMDEHERATLTVHEMNRRLTAVDLEEFRRRVDDGDGERLAEEVADWLDRMGRP